jgi:acetyl-CoA C-acetyltransferase
MGTYIKGVGMTPFGNFQKSSHELCFDAIMEALLDAHMDPSQIDAIVIGKNDFSLDGEHQRLVSGILSSILKKEIPIFQVSAACASGGIALWNAAQLNYGTVLALGVEKLSFASTPQITSEFLTAAESVYEQDEGVIFPAQYALAAQEYMKVSGATSNDFGLVALKNHENAFLNEKARFFGKKISKEMIDESAVVCSPLRIMDCSVSVDGAAAVIISKDKADIEIAGSGMSTTSLGIFERENLSSFSVTREAAKLAYQEAGIIAQDVNCAEVHDAFTPAEIMAYEDLGFSKKTEGKTLIREGKTKLNGSIPINMSGGLKAKGHPVGATGLSQVYEIVKQLRGEARGRQISNPKIGLTHNVGGCGTTCVVHVLKKL